MKRKKTSKESTNKAKFYGRAALGFLFGVVLGILFGIEKEFDILSLSTMERIQEFIIFISPYLLLLNTFISIVVIECNVRKNGRLLEKNDDSLYDSIDSSLSKGLIWSSALIFINFLLFSIGFYNLKDNSMNSIFLFTVIIVFMASLFIAIMYQSKIVTMVKRMNPEKKGDVYDNKFGEQWLDSCDELEKMIIYEACYKLYDLMNKIISFLFIVFTILGMFYDVGILLIIILGLLQCVLLFGYMYYASKLEKRKK